MEPSPARPHRTRWKRILRAVAIALATLLLVAFFCWYWMLRTPGRSYRGPLPELDERQIALADELHRDVKHLADTIGERNRVRYDRLCQAADYIETEFEIAGYTVTRETYLVNDRDCYNLEVALTGGVRSDEIVIVGAHYDTVIQSPGANDNASGVAAMLALARRFARATPERTLRFVAFTNEEPPFFQSDDMGSRVYARRCRERDENIVAMLALETMGYYSDEPESQHYPAALGAIYPSTGNFIGVVGNVGSRPLVHRVVESFRRHAQFPCEAGAVPSRITGVGWSDHWSFWEEGYQAVMITDTAPFRYPYYHLPEDTPDKLDYERMARVVAGLHDVVAELAGVAH
jgi:hypothetical protein